jgi:subtilisin family serine protease
VVKPAWSWQFSPGHLRPVDATALPFPISRQWAWANSTGRGVKVAVVDSGIDPDHPAVGSVAGGAAFDHDPAAPGGVRVTEGQHADLFGHGTACAGIIRRLVPGAELYSVRVLGRRLTGKGLVFAAGVRWAIEHGMQVVNLSLSTGRREYFALFHELADLAYFRGVMLVGAVNNVPAPSYPSQYASVFSVAANQHTDPFAITYNSAPPVEFGAPGIDLKVAWLDGRTVTATGNSFAAPHVAGLIARILAKHPGLTPFEVKTVLRACATNAIPSPIPAEPDRPEGSGINRSDRDSN